LRSVGIGGYRGGHRDPVGRGWIFALTAFGIHAEFLPHWQIKRIEGY